jgi:hypothetical protein
MSSGSYCGRRQIHNRKEVIPMTTSHQLEFGAISLLENRGDRPQWYIEPGSVLPNGAIVIASKKVDDKDRIWIVLCWYPTTEEYATWAMTEHDGGTFWGHYFHPWQISAAVEDYKERR